MAISALFFRAGEVARQVQSGDFDATSWVLPGIGATPAEASWLEPAGRPNLSSPLLVLGMNNGTVVLYDPFCDATLEVGQDQVLVKELLDSSKYKVAQDVVRNAHNRGATNDDRKAMDALCVSGKPIP